MSDPEFAGGEAGAASGGSVAPEMWEEAAETLQRIEAQSAGLEKTSKAAPSESVGQPWLDDERLVIELDVLGRAGHGPESRVAEMAIQCARQRWEDARAAGGSGGAVGPYPWELSLFLSAGRDVVLYFSTEEAARSTEDAISRAQQAEFEAKVDYERAEHQAAGRSPDYVPSGEFLAPRSPVWLTLADEVGLLNFPITAVQGYRLVNQGDLRRRGAAGPTLDAGRLPLANIPAAAARGR